MPIAVSRGARVLPVRPFRTPGLAPPGFCQIVALLPDVSGEVASLLRIAQAVGHTVAAIAFSDGCLQERNVAADWAERQSGVPLVVLGASEPGGLPSLVEYLEACCAGLRSAVVIVAGHARIEEIERAAADLPVRLWDRVRICTPEECACALAECPPVPLQPRFSATHLS